MSKQGARRVKAWSLLINIEWFIGWSGGACRLNIAHENSLLADPDNLRKLNWELESNEKKDLMEDPCHPHVSNLTVVKVNLVCLARLLDLRTSPGYLKAWPTGGVKSMWLNNVGAPPKVSHLLFALGKGIPSFFTNNSTTATPLLFEERLNHRWILVIRGAGVPLAHVDCQSFAPDSSWIFPHRGPCLRKRLENGSRTHTPAILP